MEVMVVSSKLNPLAREEGVFENKSSLKRSAVTDSSSINKILHSSLTIVIGN
jgi:hypothetical protein